MDSSKNTQCIHNCAKALFVVQGLLVLASCVNDVLAYSCSHSDDVLCCYHSNDVQCVRVINITWILLCFASIHVISGVLSFFYSCTSTIYQPLICFILWTCCMGCLVFYHVSQLYDYEQVVSTTLAVTLTFTTTYAILIPAEIWLHATVICRRQGGLDRVAQYNEITMYPL